MWMKAHGLLLYLPSPLYLALIRLQADRGLGRSYAGLLALTEGLYRLGYLSEDAYLQFTKRYSKPLETVVESGMRSPTKREDIPPFRDALEEWGHRDIEWKQKWAVIASRYQNVKEAQILLKKAVQEGIIEGRGRIVIED